jgi:hypothetical protein
VGGEVLLGFVHARKLPPEIVEIPDASGSAPKP